MAERAPLVLPPDTNTLPPPGEPTYAAREDWPTDTDAQRKKVAAAAQAKQTADDVAADPTNPYAGKPTLLDKAFGKLIKKKDSDEDEVADVPEPDPSDKTPEDEAREQKAVAANGAPKPLDQPIIEAPKPEQIRSTRRRPTATSRCPAKTAIRRWPPPNFRTNVNASA